MTSDDSFNSETVQRTPVGRPKLGQARRVRITTTIEPSKLARLREHARRAQKSLGQLADEYVLERFPLSQDPSE
jgi:hypothetical protein